MSADCFPYPGKDDEQTHHDKQPSQARLGQLVEKPTHDHIHTG